MPKMRATSLGNRCQSANLRGECSSKKSLKKAAPILEEYSLGDSVCFKTDQSGWTAAGHIIGFEGAKLVWLFKEWGYV